MVVESIPIYSLAKGLIRYVPGFLLRRHFTAEKLADLVYCDLAPRGEPAHINVGQVASARVYLQLINLSPFLVEMDRGQFDMNSGGGRIDFVHLKRLQLEPGVIVHLALQAGIADGSALAIARSPEDMTSRTRLDGVLEFNCGVRNFSKRIGLSEIRPVVINAQSRRVAA